MLAVELLLERAASFLTSFSCVDVIAPFTCYDRRPVFPLSVLEDEQGSTSTFTLDAHTSLSAQVQN